MLEAALEKISIMHVSGIKLILNLRKMKILEVIILARPGTFLGRVLGRIFGPDPIFLGFGQAKNNFLVYFLAWPVLARKSPLI